MKPQEKRELQSQLERALLGKARAEEASDALSRRLELQKKQAEGHGLGWQQQRAAAAFDDDGSDVARRSPRGVQLGGAA